MRDDAGPVVSVVAPAGYGKTTLLSQWAERRGQAFAWVSVDEADNDPKVLLTYIAHALDAVEPVGERVFDALASRSASVPGSVVPRRGGVGLSGRCSGGGRWLWGRCMCGARWMAGPGCGCWRGTSGRDRGGCGPAGTSRRCAPPGCAPRARSPRSAPVICR